MPPPRLESQGDGRRLALEVLRQIRDAGRKRCSANPYDRKPQQQFGALLGALYMLQGKPQALAGFAVVMLDLLGAVLDGSDLPELYAERERKSLFLRWHGERPKTPGRVPRIPEPRTGHRTNARKEIDWAALNPGRRLRETGTLPEGRDAPESAGDCRPRSPDHDRPK